MRNKKGAPSGAARPLTGSEIDEVLASLLDGKIRIAAWRHPLGFIHIRLDGQLPLACKFRLHLWSEAQDPAILGGGDRIHNHSFDFISHIVAGRILERRYEFTPDIDGDWRCYEVVNADGRSDRRVKPQRLRIASTRETTHFAGDTYRMDAGAFHDALALEPQTVTMVLATPRPDVVSLLLARGDEPGKESVAWPEVPAFNILRIVDSVLRQRSEQTS